MRDRGQELSPGQANLLTRVSIIASSTRELATQLHKTIGHTHSMCQRLRRRGLLVKASFRGSPWRVTDAANALLDRKPRQCPRCQGIGHVR